MYSIRAHFLLVVALSLTLTPIWAQKVPFRELEQKIYRLNNQLKYTESQALLLPVLESDLYSAPEKYQAALWLSYTYKRVYDYQSTLRFLATARRFADQTPNQDKYLATIASQEAFVYFDIQEYAKADSLMKRLETTYFRHIDQENKAKLVMQQGYLLFLNKQYAEAEAAYDRALGWLRTSSPCDLPMILVKKMQLYAATDQMDRLRGALRQSSAQADSCGIIKYHLYAYEELLNIYRKRNDTRGITTTTQTLDSLRKLYAQQEKLSALHNQKETILLRDKEDQLNTERTNRQLVTALAIGLLLASIGLLTWLVTYRRKQARIETELRQMKAELEHYLTLSKTAQPEAILTEQSYLNTLSERQREVLNYMAEGLSNREIADKLFISENTVKYHIKNIYQLLDIKDRKEFLVNIKK